MTFSTSMCLLAVTPASLPNRPTIVSIGRTHTLDDSRMHTRSDVHLGPPIALKGLNYSAHRGRGS